MNSSTSSLTNLLSPLRIGDVAVRNRIVSTGHDTMLAEHGRVGDRLVAYHEARARGGAGLIIVQVTGVHETARYTGHSLMAVDDSCMPGFRALADRVHAHGARLFVQLFHPGREVTETFDGSKPVAYAPSATPSERYHVIPTPLTKPLIDEIVTGYAMAACRMRDAGLDGVEIVASHGYLPAQFLAPGVNQRTDEYGGSFENRARFLVEILETVRAAVGPEFPVGLRISGSEMTDEGLDEGLSIETIRHVSNLLSYVNIVHGTSATLGGAIHIAPPMYIANNYVAPFSEKVKKMVDIPVMVTGRINQPQDAEKIIAAGQADLCGMTRALICDPEMPAKAARSEFDDIRACIGCNQACIGHFHMGMPISCIQHPVTGRELTYGALTPASQKKRVLVVGGGPGGMKAAAVAAGRGHHVTLCEAQPQLGGQALLAQLLPGRAEFGGIVTNLSREIELAGVSVKTSTRVGRRFVAEGCFDAVVLATGGEPRWPEHFEYNAEDVPDGGVVQAVDVLRGQVKIGKSVVVADWTCDWVGLGMAELLAERGCHVRLVVNGKFAGETIQSYTRDSALRRLHKLGVEIVPFARLFGRDADTVYFQNTISDEPIVFEGVDTLVLAQGSISENTLYKELVDLDCQLFLIGDAAAARTAEEAVLEGLKVAAAI